MTKKEMSSVLVRMVKYELENATNNLIDAKAELAAWKVREECEEEKVNEGLKMGNQYSEQVRRYEVAYEACQKDVEKWRGIQDFVVEMFINNA